MPRKPRHAITGCPHHITNRGNDRRRLFFDDSDYEEFLRLLTLGKERSKVKIYGINVMPNHFHGLIQPEGDGELSSYCQWVLGSYATRFRERTVTRGHGHVFQRRFWSDPIKDERHFLGVLRYVEANPVRAELVNCAGAWQWSSVVLRDQQHCALLDPLPFPLPMRWLDLVNLPQEATELERIRRPIRRGRPKKISDEAPAAESE